MCKKNITVPFNFYCYTESPYGLNENIKVIDYVEQYLDPIVYNKLFLFSNYIHEKSGKPDKCLYFDLDMIIKHNINKLLDFNFKTLAVVRATWKDTHYGLIGPPWYDHNINSSCMMWNPHYNFKIWNHFNENPDFYMLKYKNGIDPYLYYEHGQRGDLPKEFFYSYYYGGDLEYTEWARGENGKIQAHLLKDFFEPIPIVLMNGEGFNHMYRFKQYYED